MPYFAQHGYECFAVSMRAHGGSDAAGAADGHMADQIADLASVIASLPQPPILVAHSLGGIVAQRWVPSFAVGRRRRWAAGCGVDVVVGSAWKSAEFALFVLCSALCHVGRVPEVT